jgi:hypothetical protein
VRALCLFTFGIVLLQLFGLDEPRFAQTLTTVLWDKLVHATAFGAFATLLWIGVGSRWPLAVWGAIVCVGALDETHQLFVPGRDAEVLDVVADAIGAGIALAIGQLWAAWAHPATRAERSTVAAGD